MIIDIILIVLVAIGFYLGLMKGIVKAVFLLISIVISLMAAVNFTSQTSKFLIELFGTESAFIPIASFILTFLISFALLHLIAKAIGSSVPKKVQLANRILGGAFLSFLAAFMFSGLLSFADAAYIIPKGIKMESLLYSYLERLPDSILSFFQTYIVPTFQAFWKYVLQAFNQVTPTIETTETIQHIHPSDTTSR